VLAFLLADEGAMALSAERIDETFHSSQRGVGVRLVPRDTPPIAICAVGAPTRPLTRGRHGAVAGLRPDEIAERIAAYGNRPYIVSRDEMQSLSGAVSDGMNLPTEKRREVKVTDG
jgi:hypothetical protein